MAPAASSKQDADYKPPFIDKGLLEYLQRLYPDRLPELTDDDRKIWFNRGCAEVIRHLQHLYSQQKPDIIFRQPY